MGRSPGKWIKRVLLGKKSSKTNFSKKDESGKEAFLVTKAPSTDLDVNPPDSEHCNTNASMQKSSSETGMAIHLPHGADPSSTANQDADVHTKSTLESCSLNDGDALQQEQAAAVVQAAFRGYLARRAFWALKGIIRLQALIRGHLVRRQAVATLRCMQGIIKLQAVVRGRRVRLSDTGLEVHKAIKPRKLVDSELLDSNGICCQPTKLSRNAFAQKLSASLSMAIPLSFQYDPVEPNSAWNWLERWSSSRFWELLKEPKVRCVSKSHRKQGTRPSVEVEAQRSKRSVRRAPSTTADNNLLSSTAENGKSRNNLKKVNHHAELAPENPQSELEKVKRSLRKISLSKTQNDDISEAVSEKPKNKAIKEPDTPVHNVVEHVLNDSSENQSEKAVAVLKVPKPESAPEQLPDEAIVPHDESPAVRLPHLEDSGKDEVLSMVNEELISNEEPDIKENNGTRRRKSLPAKQEYPENGSQNTPRVPSYMAATESAKAKLRAQGSQGLAPDVIENGSARRHSLPSSRNGKLNSPSPRSHKLVQASGKVATKSDKSLLSSRDTNEKTIQAEWKR